MSTFNADLRAGVVEMLNDYKASAGIALNVYPSRPGIFAVLPTAFVDRLSVKVDHTWQLQQQRPVAYVHVVWGNFDSKDAVTKRDDFCDGFIDWVFANPHAAGANAVCGIASIEDLPAYSPDWTEKQAVYYATEIAVEANGE